MKERKFLVDENMIMWAFRYAQGQKPSLIKYMRNRLELLLLILTILFGISIFIMAEYW